MTRNSPLRNVQTGISWGDGKPGLWVYILTLAGVLLSQVSAYAIFGIGVHGGMDVLTIDEQELITFTLISDTL